MLQGQMWTGNSGRTLEGPERQPAAVSKEQHKIKTEGILCLYFVTVTAGELISLIFPENSISHML